MTHNTNPFKALALAVIAGWVMALAAAQPCRADFTRRLSYQGRLTNSDGVPLASGSYDMTFKLYTVSTGGSSVWSEDHTAGNGSPINVDYGLFSVVLGGIASLNSVNFNSAEYYVEVMVAGTTYSPRQQLTAAPFALNIPDGLITSTKMADGAALAEIIDDDGAGSGLDCDLLDGYDWSTIPNLADKWVDETGDTMAGTLNMGNNAIINVDWANSDDGAGSALDADLLDGVDSGAFFVLSDNETVTGTPSFNGGTSGTSPPFNVDSTFVVTNLNADLLDGYTAADFQLRVSGTCAAGGSIRAIAADGTVTCEPDDDTTDHGALGGLGDDDHPQYFHLSQNETVSGTPAFNGGTSGADAPFSVDSTFVVTNLNADLLDGQHGAYYMPATTDNWVNITGDTMTGYLNFSGTSGISMGDKGVYLRGANASDVNHGMIVNTTVDGPEFRGYAGFTWKTGVAGATERMKLDTSALNVYMPAFVGSSNTSKMIKFTDSWSSYPDSTTGSEISNDTTAYKTLMIVGNKSFNSAFRRVSVWDRLEVNGIAYAQGVTAGNIQTKLGPGTGSDGTWHSVQCDNGYAITAVRVYANSYWDGNLSIVCQYLGNMLNTGCAWTGGSGTADGAWHTQACPANTVATGLRIWANTYLDNQMALCCTSVVSGSVNKPGDWSVSGSNKCDGCYQGNQCPSNTYLTTFGAWVNDYFDEDMLFVCGSPVP